MSQISHLESKQQQEESVLKLLPEIKQGRQEAIAEFFEIYSDDIYNFTIRQNNFSEDEAGDFYLYAFEKLKDGRRLNNFSGKSKFRTWFFAVLRNLAIDFLRSRKKQLRTSSLVWLDANNEIIDISDKKSGPIAEEQENELFENFLKNLNSLKPEQKILFKLAYIHFFDLDEAEVKWLGEKNSRSTAEILKNLQQLKTIMLEQNSELKSLEDKLSEYFQAILQVESRLDVFFKENPQLKRNPKQWNEDFYDKEYPHAILELIHSYAKKKKKHENLLNQQNRSLLSVRVPYKSLAEFFDYSAGVISVKLLRIIEKINKSL